MISATATAEYITVRAAASRASISSRRVRSNWVGHSQVPSKYAEGRIACEQRRRGAGPARSGQDTNPFHEPDTHGAARRARLPPSVPGGAGSLREIGGSTVRRIVAVVCALGLSAGLGLVPGSAQAKSSKAKVQHLQVLAINDFHGNLEPPTGSGGRIPISPTATQDVGG